MPKPTTEQRLTALENEANISRRRDVDLFQCLRHFKSFPLRHLGLDDLADLVERHIEQETRPHVPNETRAAKCPR